MKAKTKLHSLGAIMLLLLFAACILITLTYGASAYRGLSDDVEQQYNEGTALSYIAAKVRAGDSAQSVRLTTVGEQTALAIDEMYEGIIFTTYIYQYGDAVYEIYTEQGVELTVTDGFEILKADSLNFTLNDDLLTILCTVGERTGRVIIDIKSGAVS